MKTCTNEAERLTAWVAIAGGIFAYLNIIFMVILTRADMSLTLDGGWMLTLPAEAREYFRLSMFADVLGFYLPVLVIGGYLWNRFRDEAGAKGDMAVLAITTYVVLGVTGASLQLAVLNPLAELHAAGSEAVKAAAETTWTAIAVGSQRGLWWCEGPVVLFWGVVVAPHLKKEGCPASLLWPLTVVGWSFVLFFVTGFFPVLEQLSYLCLVIAVAFFPMWMLMFGLHLRRRLASSPLGA
ncbi:hypothetical protein B6S59_31970 [Pseudomonas sp. A46]|nr:hypothetical protein [Pseudomonas sp. A46]OWJ88961.1 hypothetical protein B6S59_31970 [Pseudomonas sp. A46]